MKRKGVLITLILVVIAIVLAVVFINMFKERTTKSLSEKLNTFVETGYLAPEGEQNKKIDEWLSVLSANNDSELVDEKDRIKSYKNSLIAYETIAQFFNRHLIQLEATSVYAKNRGKIEKSLNTSQKKADKLESYINEKMQIVEGNAYWTATTWIDCKQDITDIINYTTDAFTRLANVFNSSMPTTRENLGIMNNTLSKLILNTMSSMITKISADVEVGNPLSEKLLVFVNAYLTLENENIITQFPYSSKNFQNIISEITTSGENSEHYQEFIRGELSALMGEGI